MADPVEQAILALAERAAGEGISMGAIVDQLVGGGHDEKAVEQAIWRLLQRRRLTPQGFVARTLRRHSPGGRIVQRVYEFVLIPWSPALDRQLELGFGEEAES